MTNIDTSSVAFSPFESLFLCQSIAQHGVANTSFETISKELRQSSTTPVVSDARLGAESLKTFFLRLLKTEAKAHLQRALIDGDGKGGRDGSVKRAAKSPQLSKIEDVNAHAQLIPALVDKLYVSYKDEALREIRAEEQRYTELIARRANRKTQDTSARQGIVPPEGGPSQQPTNVSSPVQYRGSVQESTGTRRPSFEVRDGRAVSRPRTSDLKIDAILNSETPTANSPQRTPASSAPYNTQAGAPASQAAPASELRQPALPSHAALHQPIHEPVRPNIGGAPLFFNGQSTYPAPVLPQVPGMSTGSPTPLAHWSPSGSPTTNRPPQSMQPRQLSSPVDSIRRTSLPPSTTSPPVSRPQVPTSLYQQSAQYAARPPPFQQQSFYQHPPGRGGVMLPPFQVQPQTQNPPFQQQPYRQVGTPLPARSPIAAQQFAASEPRPLAHRKVSDLRTSVGPVSQTPPARPARAQAPQSDFLYTPGSTTGWKLPGNTRLPQTILRAPSLSPERDTLVAIPGKPRAQQGKAAGNISKASKSTSGRPAIVTTANMTTDKKINAARALSATPSATASLTLNGRTRSQSVVSQHEDVLATDHVKTEHSTLPSEVDDNSELTETPTRLNGPRGRSRNHSTTSVALAASKKRKRELESMSTERDMQARADTDVIPSSTAETDAPPLDTETIDFHNNTILAYRNFHKMTAPIMNNITSHKHASIFANPVKDKTAEGYSDIIRRPQDLKSIRAAIMAGSRAVAAATASGSADSPAGAGTPNGASTPGASGSTGGLVELPWSIDLVPPRGIVNGAQLEQEVMRMFANAVMFNPGNEGVVEDAREMFENVEAAVHAWRATQKEISASAEKTKAKKMEEEDVKKGKEDSVDEPGDAEMTDVTTSGTASSSRRTRILV